MFLHYIIDFNWEKNKRETNTYTRFLFGWFQEAWNTLNYWNNMDELIERCGSFGKYQKMLLGIIGYITAVNGLLQFLSVFNNAVPQLTCHLKSSHLLHPDKQELYSLDSCDVFANISLSHEQNIETPYECEYDTSKLEMKSLFKLRDMRFEALVFNRLKSIVKYSFTLSCRASYD